MVAFFAVPYDTGFRSDYIGGQTIVEFPFVGIGGVWPLGRERFAVDFCDLRYVMFIHASNGIAQIVVPRQQDACSAVSNPGVILT